MQMNSFFYEWWCTFAHISNIFPLCMLFISFGKFYKLHNNSNIMIVCFGCCSSVLHWVDLILFLFLSLLAVFGFIFRVKNVLPPTWVSCWLNPLMLHWLVQQHRLTIDWHELHLDQGQCWNHSEMDEKKILF